MSWYFNTTGNYSLVDTNRFEIKEKDAYKKKRLEGEIERQEALTEYYSELLVDARSRIKELKKELKDLE